MSLYHRCDCPQKKTHDCEHVWWFKCKHDGATIRESTEQTSQRKAAKVEIKRKGEILDQGTGIAKKKRAIGLKAHLLDYLEWARNHHPATANERDVRILLPPPPPDPHAKTRRRTRARGKSLLEVLGDKPIDQVTAFNIEQWRSVRCKTPMRGGRTVSRSTVNRDLNVVRSVFTKAVEWKRLKGSQSPFADEAVENYAVDEGEVRVLTPAERGVVLTQLQPRVCSTYCAVTLETLMRLGEVLRLRRDDLLGDDVLQRRLKGGKVRPIVVSRTLIATLRGYLTTPEQVSIFGDPPPRRDLTSVQLSRAFRAAGLRGITHHAMRHTGITDMLDAGINGKAIMVLAGWTTMRMLERYGHVRDAELVRATTGTAALNAAAYAAAARQAEAEQAAAAQAEPDKSGAQKGAHRVR